MRAPDYIWYHGTTEDTLKKIMESKEIKVSTDSTLQHREFIGDIGTISLAKHRGDTTFFSGISGLGKKTQVVLYIDTRMLDKTAMRKRQLFNTPDGEMLYSKNIPVAAIIKVETVHTPASKNADKEKIENRGDSAFKIKWENIGSIVVTIFNEQDTKVAALSNLEIADSMQGKGYGKALVQRAEEKAKEMGAKECITRFVLKTARGFWKKRGYKEIKSRNISPFDRCWRKNIDSTTTISVERFPLMALYDLQDTTIEHAEPKDSGVVSAYLEAAGDIFRELCLEHPDNGYIAEKLRKLSRFKGMPPGDRIEVQTVRERNRAYPGELQGYLQKVSGLTRKTEGFDFKEHTDRKEWMFQALAVVEAIAYWGQGVYHESNVVKVITRLVESLSGRAVF